LSLFSCTTHIDNLQVDPSFTYQAVNSGKMAVGGVVSMVNPLKEDVRIRYGNLLRQSILAQREQFKVLFSGFVANKIGKNNYIKLINEYRGTGVLADNHLGTLKSKVNGVRYLLFAMVENDMVDKYRSDTKDKKSGDTTITTTTSRQVSCSLQIYDLTQSKIVWSGTVDKKYSNSNEFKKEKKDGLIDLVEAIGKAANNQKQEEYAFPSPPALEKVLKRAFSGFAENFPEKE